jgi:hypothetical protein
MTSFLLVKTNIIGFWDICGIRKTLFNTMVRSEFSCSCYFSGDQPRGAFPLQFGSINMGMMNGLQVCPISNEISFYFCDASLYCSLFFVVLDSCTNKLCPSESG